MIDLAIYGIGSPFGDDRLGWEVIKRLQEENYFKNFPGSVELSALDRPGINLLNLIQEKKTVVLIDAVQSTAEFGTFHRLENEELLTFFPTYSSHNLGLAACLAMANALNCFPEKLIFYGLEIDELLFQFAVSDELNVLITKFIATIKIDLATYWP